MSDGHRLVQAMRKAGRTPQNEVVDIVVGEVISTKPLKVKVENRELTEAFLVLGALCKETHIYTSNVKKLNHRHLLEITQNDAQVNPEDGTDSTLQSSQIVGRETASTPPHDTDYDIMLWRGLAVRDRVLMLKVAQGQKYYILQREEGVT